MAGSADVFVIVALELSECGALLNGRITINFILSKRQGSWGLLAIRQLASKAHNTRPVWGSRERR
jgi:hypothetical protein